MNASAASRSTPVPVCACCLQIPQMSRELAKPPIERSAVATVQRRRSLIFHLRQPDAKRQQGTLGPQKTWQCLPRPA